MSTWLSEPNGIFRLLCTKTYRSSEIEKQDIMYALELWYTRKQDSELGLYVFEGYDSMFSSASRVQYQERRGTSPVPDAFAALGKQSEKRLAYATCLSICDKPVLDPADVPIASSRTGLELSGRLLLHSIGNHHAFFRQRFE
jgi:hypothetical protein